MTRPPRLLLLYSAVFFVSGLAGLAQEVAWTRALGQGIGTSLQSTSAVLAVFLGGLAGGATIGEWFAGRLRRPLRAYWVIEFGIALYAAASPIVARLATGILAAWGPQIESATGLVLARAAVAAAALLPVTLAMGATLPILVRAAVGSGAPPGSAIAILYGTNTLGGAAGAALASFALLPLLGTRLTFLAAAILNAGAGVAALAIERRHPLSTPPDAAVGAAELTLPKHHPHQGRLPVLRPALVILAAALSGAIGALLQTGWTRLATLSFGASVYSLGTTLAAFICGLGIGPFLVARRLRSGAGRATAAWTIGGTAVLSIAVLPALGRLPEVAASMAGLFGQVGPALVASQFALLFLILLPAAALQGATVPALAVAAGGAAHRGVARAYAAASIGSVAGFLIAGFALVPRFGTQRTLVIAAAAGIALSAMLVALAPRGPRPMVGAALLLAVALATLLVPFPPWEPAILTSGGLIYGPVYRAAGGHRPARAMRRRGDIVFQREDGTSVVTVRRSPAGPLSLQINGRTEASTGGDLGTQFLSAHLPLLLRPGAGDVLVIGLASGITTGAVARHPVRTLRVVEIAPAVVAAARLFDDAHGRVLDDPRLGIVVDDARSHLLVRTDLYDVITSQPSNPWVAGVANLFTEEFYRLVRSRLNPGGVFCQWMQAYRMEPRDLAGIVASFLAVFPQATLWEESAGGGDYFLVGGTAPIRIDPDRWDPASPAWADLRRVGIDGPAGLLSRFVAGPAGLVQIAAGAPLHTDDNLYLEWRAPLALFRDTLQAQTAFLDRHREAPATVLTAGILDTRPVLAAELRREAAHRADRIAALQSMQPADLAALTDPFLAAGIESLRAGRPFEALTHLQHAAADNTGSAQALWLLGEAYAGTGLDDAAAVAFRAAVELDPRLTQAWIAIGRRLQATGRLEEAQEAFVKATAVGSRGRSGALARNNLGAVRLQRGDPETAEADFVAAIDLDPSLAAAHANLGVARRRRGDDRQAESCYRVAIDLDPLNTDARYNLARLLAATGRNEEAGAVLKAILAIDPGDETARAALNELDPGS